MCAVHVYLKYGPRISDYKGITGGKHDGIAQRANEFKVGISFIVYTTVASSS